MDKAEVLAVRITELEKVQQNLTEHLTLNNALKSVNRVWLDQLSVYIKSLKDTRLKTLEDQVKLLRKQRAEPLYLDDKTVDELMSIEDKDAVIFNLHEDALCLKEQVCDLREMLVDAISKMNGWNQTPTRKRPNKGDDLSS
jgi:hypothetical protein